MSLKYQTVFASAARTATPTAVEIDVSDVTYLALVVDVTTVTLTPSVVFDIDFVDALSGKFITVLASAAQTAAGTVHMQVGPGIVAVANLAAQMILGDKVRITATHGDVDSITYSVSATLI